MVLAGEPVFGNQSSEDTIIWASSTIQYVQINPEVSKNKQNKPSKSQSKLK